MNTPKNINLIHKLLSKTFLKKQQIQTNAIICSFKIQGKQYRESLSKDKLQRCINMIKNPVHRER